jgi:hypothetical protein
MVRKRGNRWYYDFMIRGVRYRESIPEARNKSQAERVEAKVKLEVFEGKYGKELGSTLLTDFVEQMYLPWARLNKRRPQNDELHCRVINEYFAGKTFREISPMLIEKFKKERRESNTRRGGQRSPASVNRELEVLSKVFSLACDNSVAASNPCRKVRKLRQDNQRKRYLSPEEEERLMAVLVGQRAHVRALVVLAIHTGMRRGELLSISSGSTWTLEDLCSTSPTRRPALIGTCLSIRSYGVRYWNCARLRARLSTSSRIQRPGPG